MACSLKKHVRCIHQGIKYPCHICQKGLSSLAEVKTHIETVHEGIRKHICEHCGKKFGRREHLRTHLRAIHKDPRNYDMTPVSNSNQTLSALAMDLSK